MRWLREPGKRLRSGAPLPQHERWGGPRLGSWLLQAGQGHVCRHGCQAAGLPRVEERRRTAHVLDTGVGLARPAKRKRGEARVVGRRVRRTQRCQKGRRHVCWWRRRTRLLLPLRGRRQGCSKWVGLGAGTEALVAELWRAQASGHEAAGPRPRAVDEPVFCRLLRAEARLVPPLWDPHVQLFGRVLQRVHLGVRHEDGTSVQVGLETVLLGDLCQRCFEAGP